jgi:RNA polymerase sigma-70 factor (ECF subfamily)
MNTPQADLADEPALIAQARAGDQAAFEQLVTAYSARVFGALRRFGLDAQAADEVAQQVFVRAWRGLPGFQERSRLSTWLYRIAFNEAQRQLARRPGSASTQGDVEDAIAELPAAPDTDPEERILSREFAKVLEAALAQLPAELRAAVVLRDLEGLSTEEAASISGVREGAFKSRLHRGRTQLRVLLKPYLEID